jgi:hypothetical protein
MDEALGRKTWVVPEGYIPEWSHGIQPQMKSHETLCLLNTSDAVAHVQLEIFYADRDPVGPYFVDVQAKRTKHLRLNDLKSPEPIPVGTDFSMVLHSDIPIVVQHTRLDSRQNANAIFSTMAFPS